MHTQLRRGLALGLAAVALAGGMASTASASLIVDHVWCHVDTDDDWSDDIYTITFRGNTLAPFDSNVAVKGPGNFWNDFDEGNDWSQDINIAKWSPDVLHVVMVVEVDDGIDISGNALSLWKAQTDLAWKAQMFSLLGVKPGPATAAQKQIAAQAIVEMMHGLSDVDMEFPKGNDDIVGLSRIAGKPGELRNYHFIGDGGWYQFRFKVG